MLKLRYAIIGSVLGLLLLSLGCVSPIDAERIAGKLFEAISGQDFEAATSYYSTEFFQMTPKDDWIKELKSINGRHGDLKSWNLISWHVAELKSGSSGKTNFELVYKTTYVNGSAKESLSLVKLGDSVPSIIGHEIEFLQVTQLTSSKNVQRRMGP